jgi:hypothetical protein
VNLHLSAVDVVGPLRWRWELRDEATGEVIAEHHVALDGTADSDQLAAFGDLYEYLRWHADPQWYGDEPPIVRATALWARRAVLGDAITTAITAAAPVTVLVSVPAPADQALLWPLELAFADGAPLAVRGDVSFVYCLGRSGAVPGEPMRPLRVLAVFSSPARTRVVPMRRERHELAALIRRIADRDSVAVELQVLQYGVTRQRLGEVIGSGGGWDMVHLAGHGTRGRFLLERPDGSADWVSTADLTDLLRPAQGRLKLAMLASCKSAAEDTTDALRLFGLPGQTGAGTRPAPDQATGHVSGLARGLTEELGCAVVATRYPVTVEFSIAFNQVFYERLLSGGDSVGVATARALAAVLAGPPADGSVSSDGPVSTVPGEAVFQGVTAAAAGVFGESAAGLTMKPGPAGLGLHGARAGAATGRLTGFPDQPERFAGRNAIMTAASAALRAGNGTTAVLLHGMPGIGKTACMLELAYLFREQFSAAAFWRPPAVNDPGLVLRSLAEALHQQLRESGSGFGLPPRWGKRRWNIYARRLRETMRASRVLVVIDNLEELLTPDGSWRDPRWEAILSSLAAHGGVSRLVAASRFAPTSFARSFTENSLLLPVGPLPRAEAENLALELPALRALVFDGLPPALDRINRAGWKRAREALDRVQGHPGLLELDPAAVFVQPAPLAQAKWEQAERDIGVWAAATLAVLPPDAKLMAWFVAGLEPRDRRLPVISGTWPGLWRRLGRTAAPPEPRPLLDTLSTAALTGDDDLQAGPAAPQDSACLLHPVVAGAIRRETPADVRDAADSELGAYWRETAGQDGNGAEDRAGAALLALPYLTRRRDWDSAAALLDDAIRRGALLADGLGSHVPELRQVADSAAAPAARAALALATQATDRPEGRRLLEESLAGAESAGDHCLAWVVAGHLADALRDTGHLDQALDVLARQERYAQVAGLGPWTKLAGHSRRLVVLARLGRKEQVLVEVTGERDRMRRLAEMATSGELTGVVPWAVRERILGTGRDCALAFGRWREALDLGAEIQDSRRQRCASRTELAGTRLFDAYPLIRLRRLTEAAELLMECQQVFEDNGDVGNLSHVYTERADLEAELNHTDAAVWFARSALRMTYTRTIPDPIADAHQRLARYLLNAGGPPKELEAHWLAAALLYRLGGEDRALDDLMRLVPPGLRAGRGPRHQPGIADPPPRTLAELIDTAEQASGVHLAELITAIEPDAHTVTRTLTAILNSTAGQGPAVASLRAQGRQFLFEELGGYELASNPGLVSLVNRFRGWLGPQANQKREPEAGPNPP